MSTSILAIAALVISLVQLAGGFAAGWFTRGHSPDVKGNPGGGDKSADKAALAAQKAELEQAREIFADVQNIAASMRSDVGQHATRMERINQELSHAEDREAAVSEAMTSITEANAELNRRLREAEQKLAEQAEQIKTAESASMTDQLTGVPNRRAFDKTLTDRKQQLKTVGAPTSLVMIDIDFFKKFNDTHGHQAGDAVLKAVAKTFGRAVRETDIVARYGGEEFGLILPDTKVTDAFPLVERVRSAVEANRVQHDGKLLQCTISLGLAQLDGKEDIDTFVRRADDALYAAKKGGRNRGYFHNGAECQPINAGDKAEGGDANANLVERRKFTLKQRIAAYAGGDCPSTEQFQEMQCRDLSSEGLSFYTPQAIDWKQCVIELGTPPSVTCFVANVVKVEPIAKDLAAGFRVECRFANRLVKKSTAPAAAAPIAPLPVADTTSFGTPASV